jgi:UDPglucose 6-dehydrogenase
MNFFKATYIANVIVCVMACNFQSASVCAQNKIAVVGAGYVGLATGACFAQQESDIVTIVENNSDKLRMLEDGAVPFYEPGLADIVASDIKQGRLNFVSHVADALVTNPDIIFICVGTPSMDDGSADLSFVYEVAQEIGQSIQQYCIVVDKSTVPVGTGKQVKAIIQEQLDKRNVQIPFDVVSNPEFLQEGCAVKNFMQPDRVVVGLESERARLYMQSLYKPFLKDKADFIAMSVPSAELTKYASNAMLATRISFMNQVAQLADTVGADIEDVRHGMAKDRRIGPAFLLAGLGYGGSCFPKDVKALAYTGDTLHCDMSLVKEVEHVNALQRQYFIKQILNYYGDNLTGKVMGVWGLSFKPNTDDIRCAPALDVINVLLEHGAAIIAYDPEAMNNVKALLGDSIEFAQTADELLRVCNCLLIHTEWDEFVKHKPAQFMALKDKVVFDGRNCFDPDMMAHYGIKYFTIGRNCHQM